MNINNKLAISIICVAILFSACHQQSEPREKRVSTADSLLDAASRVRDYDRMIVLADSLESARTISYIEANLRRGYAYHKKKEFASAEPYYKKVLDAKATNADDKDVQQKAAGYYADMLFIKHDYDGALRIAVPMVQELEKSPDENIDAIILLLSTIGRCQMKLNRQKEAAETFQKDYEYNLKNAAADSSGYMLKNAVVHTANVAIRYLNIDSFPQAHLWLDRTQDLLKQYSTHPNTIKKFVEEYNARMNIYNSYTLQKMGNDEEAAAAYQDFLDSDYAKSDDGMADACSYLMEAHRYEEAANNLRELDRMMDKWGYKLTLDNIHGYLLPKYRANMGAGRRDTAMMMASKICDALDSAIVWQKNSDAAELATIYDTQQKETKIAQQESELAKQRLIGITVALGLTVIFFIAYALYRRNTIRKLAEKNAQLKIANARAEESSKMKTNFIQQISHEIRTPLNILNGFTQVVTDENMELDKDTKADISRQISENAERITSLVNKMLELSDANSQTIIERKDEVHAVQIAIQAIEHSGIQKAEHLTFEFEHNEEVDDVMLKTNATSAIRALVLLLDNAMKFTRPAKTSSYKTSGDEKAKATLKLSQADGKIMFAVEDTGIGVPPSEADRIFEEFVQLDDFYEGTGIGLTVARSLARRLDGDITIDTGHQPGARFIMTLPA